MNIRKDTGGNALAGPMAAGVIVAVTVMLLASCRTVRETENMEAHDTVLVVRTDTLRLSVSRSEKDTVWMVTEREVTLRAGGDTLRIVERVDRDRYRLVIDSTDRYRGVADSLLSRMERLEKSRQTVTSGDSWWNRWKWRVLAVAALCAGFAVGRTRLRMKG